ncbi:heterotrimeric G protein alpha subunit 4 [Flagelloscypha sp. PMI_526]|nr:heterotrimeric G protein alpha subunit 4 [Flagelloscypha sp. PMI_526]
MGGCVSSPAAPGVVVTDADREKHRQAEKALKEAKARLASQVKVLLLGSGDSGKSTILKQMRVIHKLPFSAQEIESYRQLVFDNLTGTKQVLDAMPDMELEPSAELTEKGWIQMIEDARDIRDGEPFPPEFKEVLVGVWNDPPVKQAYERGNEAALPENLVYYFGAIERLFEPTYTPTEQDIIHSRARTIELQKLHLDHEMLMVDVGGQKSERRKWIHCFQDVTSILFLVSLSGYDQCLVEDKDANQMQDAMTIWDSICHSQWFKQTSIILFLNKNDLFEKKIATSDIRTFFPDFEGEAGDVKAGRDYFKKRFARLAQKAGRQKEREIYIHITTATDTAMLRVVMAAVEGAWFECMN